MRFLVAIEPGTESTAYGVVVPDLPGCFSAGDTLEEAFENAREAIEAHCEAMAEEGGNLPAQAAMSTWQRDPEFSGWIWAVIEAPIERYFGPAEKINITVPGRILARIDAFAKRNGESRSGFLVRAAQEAMRG